MTGVKLSVPHRNTRNHLTVGKQILDKKNYECLMETLETT